MQRGFFEKTLPQHSLGPPPETAQILDRIEGTHTESRAPKHFGDCFWNYFNNRVTQPW